MSGSSSSVSHESIENLAPSATAGDSFWQFAGVGASARPTAPLRHQKEAGLRLVAHSDQPTPPSPQSTVHENAPTRGRLCSGASFTSPNHAKSSAKRHESPEGRAPRRPALLIEILSPRNPKSGQAGGFSHGCGRGDPHHRAVGEPRARSTWSDGNPHPASLQPPLAAVSSTRRVSCGLIHSGNSDRGALTITLSTTLTAARRPSTVSEALNTCALN